jgi:hypothetical protein
VTQKGRADGGRVFHTERWNTLPKLELNVPGFYLSRKHHGINGVQTYDLYTSQYWEPRWKGFRDSPGARMLYSFSANVTPDEIKDFITLYQLSDKSQAQVGALFLEQARKDQRKDREKGQ